MKTLPYEEKKVQNDRMKSKETGSEEIVVVEAEEAHKHERKLSHHQRKNMLKRALWINTWVLLSLAVSQQQMTRCYAAPNAGSAVESSPAEPEQEKHESSAPNNNAYEDDLSVTEESMDLEEYKNFHWKRKDNNSSEEPEVIVVTTVDGTMAGLARSTGELVWKQQGRNMVETESPLPWEQNSAPEGEQAKKERLLSPLVSTTTKSSSGQDWRTAAVPSVDGRVFLTAGRDSHITGSNSNDVTATSTVKELVSRAPFMDARGRWYVGSKRASAAAIDRDTGEILTVVSENSIAKRNENISLKGRNVVWVGRVDYSVSLLSAQGKVDVQFSSSEVMSTNDMVEAGLLGELEGQPEPETKLEDTSQQHAPRLMLPNSLQPERQSMLVATPGGNVAYRNPETGSIEWVSTETFDTPVAFAVESGSGISLGVDIVPDAPVPNSSQDYLSRELERQVAAMTASTEEDQTIFGALSSGQLFAMPLGQRLSKMTKPTLTLGLPQSMTSSSVSASSKALTKVPPLAGQSRQGFDLHATSSTEEQKTLIPKKACLPSSPSFPGCLVGGIHSSENFARGNSFLEESTNVFDYHKQFSFPPQFTHEKPYRKKKKLTAFNKLMSSWLPPTMLLLLFVGFQFGRQLKDKKKDEEANTSSKGSLEPSNDKDEDPAVRKIGVIQVTDEVLGFGGHGTVVYKGTLDGRQVAVKRMLKAYHASADREISLLIESDGHPNVVRYFLKEVRGDFVYLALELCDMSLLDLIVMLRQRVVASLPLAPHIPKMTKATLFEIASGVRHLHSLRIVHRDLKPANILLARNRKQKGAEEVVPTDIGAIMALYDKGDYIAKISDMGLGKQLAGQSSFGVSTLGNSSLHGHSNNGSNVGAGPGSVGWQAPEVMAFRWSSETGPDSASRLGESISEISPLDLAVSTRTSRSVDIFSLGCIFHCTMVPGCHPFGEWFEREANIMRDNVSIDALREASLEGHDLVSSMLHRNPMARPTAKQVCEHPFFWSNKRKLSFLCDLSDKIESDFQALEDGDLSQSSFGSKVVIVERNAAEVVGTAWDKVLDPDLLTNVAKFRTYDPSSVRDCLRLIRNKHHHYDELPPEVKARIGGLFEYFEGKFPNLLLHCYSLCRDILSENDKLVEHYAVPLNREKSLKRTAPSLQETEIPSKLADPVQHDGKNDPEIQTREKAGEPGLIVENEDATTEDMGLESNEHFEKDITTEASDEPPEAEKPLGPAAPDDIVIWEGSTTAKTFNCRGWMRSDDEWVRRTDASLRKRDSNVMRCATDAKFRTRLCNHWDASHGMFCPMRKKNKCVFAHGPAELRVKEGKRQRWGKLVDRNGNSSNPNHSGGEDTYGAARSIETIRKEEGKWNTDNKGGQGKSKANKKHNSGKKQSRKAQDTGNNFVSQST